jgi:hypothetical protein
VGQGSRFTFSLPLRGWRRTTETEIVTARGDAGPF